MIMHELSNYNVWRCIARDLYRYYGIFTLKVLLREVFWGIGGRFIIWMRLSGYFKGKGAIYFPLYLLTALLHRHYMFKFGICIPCSTRIGEGLYIGHFGSIVVNHAAVIGRNCNLSQGVAIGATYRGSRPGAPVIGENVYVGPGAKIIGGISIGDNVAIGANCVVTRDVPENAVVVGIPGRVISYKGSEGYIRNPVSPSKPSG